MQRWFVSLMIFATASQAFAQDDSVCNVLLPNDIITGEYEMTLGPGTMEVQDSSLPAPITAPYPKVHKIPATIVDIDGTLVLFSDKNFKLEFIDVDFDERDWDFTKGGKFDMAVNAEDFALVAGCENINDLPRLMAKGTGTYFSDDGTEVPFFTKLFVATIHDDGGVSAYGGFRATGPKIVFNLRFMLRPL
ncbi:MAG: hypothetical protein V3V13_00090 [Paracoccaceae bacterium]